MTLYQHSQPSLGPTGQVLAEASSKLSINLTELSPVAALPCILTLLSPCSAHLPSSSPILLTARQRADYTFPVLPALCQFNWPDT